MEGKGKVGSSSSSSITSQLFGPNETIASANLNSIFLPQSKTSFLLSAFSILQGTSRNNLTTKHGSSEQHKESAICNLSSSAYYGGQDVHSQSTHNHTYPTVKKDQARDDEASRGNWWQGSLYY